jgi:hypothetical protein
MARAAAPVVAALVLGGLYAAEVVGRGSPAGAAEAGLSPATGAAAAAPAPSSAGSGPGVSGDGGLFAFEQLNHDGTPSRWNPCVAVHYVVNLSQAPAGALSMVSAALAQVSAATGLQFVYDGTTSELASNNRPLAVGGRWNPVLVVWERVGQSDYLAANGEDGEGGFVAVSNPQGRWVDVTGQVALDSAAGSIPGFAQEGGWAHLLLHEFGHVVGLAHVNDTTQVMNPVSTVGAPTAYGSGDLAGLARLGASNGCLTEPSTAGF